MLDPTAPSSGNSPILFNTSDPIVTSIRVVVQVFPAGTFHYREGLNAAGAAVWRSAWGAGSTGAVYGY
jgi:hypothetical protein